ncbi:MAG: phosphoribosylformylglycinamidine synthase subunit PurL [Armatimonadota bacterium]|nr:phosphoribosylformylglycinamidine synthase subunit PurL [Armatimonadota bacterium]MDR7612879.1 phosphoribosylformylglycinamidine synthase subunit PurL [Armatimonadota bacterium]
MSAVRAPSALAGGLDTADLGRLRQRLGRPPTPLEAQMAAAMWSEHCGYRRSRAALRQLPSQGQRVIRGPGDNAGVVDLGDGWAAVFKMESHNHPSAVDPHHGAATGVGGIVRDILAMGARPIALVDSLRFGPLDDPAERRLAWGVVEGISAYANCIGVPTVAGELATHPRYRGAPLVNVACLGLARRDALAHSAASEPDAVVMLVGARTGRDGIGGAAFASAELDPSRRQEDRAAVQLGDPFAGKVLIEATLQSLQTGYVVAVQDLGAAGLVCAASEMAARGGAGVVVDLDAVPLREPQMTPREILLSESQERMLLVVQPAGAAAVAAVFRSWGLSAAVIGRVTADGRLRVRAGGVPVASLPARVLARAPAIRLSARPPSDRTRRWAVPPVPEADPPRALVALLAHPSVAGKDPVVRQYDHTVQIRTVVPPLSADAAVLRLAEMPPAALALACDGDGRLCDLDPFRGARHAVAEAAANLACVGAEPLAVTDCLNFGDPDVPEVYWTFRQAVAGLAEACRQLEIPVVGGNVSFYNTSAAGPVLPTPVVAMVGWVPDARRTCRAGFSAPGDLVVLIGDAPPALDASAYLSVVWGVDGGRPPDVDLSTHRRVLAVVREAVRQGWLRSAHDCGEGGLAVALAESAILGGVGVEAVVPPAGRVDEALFGEAPSRIVASLAPDALRSLRELAGRWGVPVTTVGRTGGTRVQLGVRGRRGWAVDLSLHCLRAAYRSLEVLL